MVVLELFLTEPASSHNQEEAAAAASTLAELFSSGGPEKHTSTALWESFDERTAYLAPLQDFGLVIVGFEDDFIKKQRARVEKDLGGSILASHIRRTHMIPLA